MFQKKKRDVRIYIGRLFFDFRTVKPIYKSGKIENEKIL